ncbi:hypothetical protein GCM10010398_23080 [Streptomyces fimbriatus]
MCGAGGGALAPSVPESPRKGGSGGDISYPWGQRGQRYEGGEREQGGAGDRGAEGGSRGTGGAEVARGASSAGGAAGEGRPGDRETGGRETGRPGGPKRVTTQARRRRRWPIPLLRWGVALIQPGAAAMNPLTRRAPAEWNGRAEEGSWETTLSIGLHRAPHAEYSP